MTDMTPNAADPTAKPLDPVVADATKDAPVEEWKPEPRQWSWKDLFTAPMLAFKPKCMLIMAVTVFVIALWYKIYPGPLVFGDKTPAFLDGTIFYLWDIVALIIFSLAATLVATFMKADLLDDEFLTFGEALGQWKGRIVSAILVPLFLCAVYGGFLALLAGCQLFASIPYFGTALYALLYPLGVLLGLFIVLLGIAVALAIFVFPSIIAIRKHGWFDNVVDTFEAVGTKPHVLVGSAIITAILLSVGSFITFGSMETLHQGVRYMPSDDLKSTESYADSVRDRAFTWVPLDGVRNRVLGLVGNSQVNGLFARRYESAGDSSSAEGWSKVTGTVTGVWKIIFSAIFLGYLGNLFIGGGMLTYLAVREDDYWDDEDLEDLDKLAKELEDEAKAEAAKVSPENKVSPEKASPEAAKPATPEAAPAVPAPKVETPVDAPKPADAAPPADAPKPTEPPKAE